jgi:hypothetical protein
MAGAMHRVLPGAMHFGSALHLSGIRRSGIAVLREQGPETSPWIQFSSVFSVVQ